jgi:hypothetical protein
MVWTCHSAHHDLNSEWKWSNCRSFLCCFPWEQMCSQLMSVLKAGIKNFRLGGFLILSKELSVSQSITHGFTWSLARSSVIIQMQLVIESLPQYYLILLTKNLQFEHSDSEFKPSGFKPGSNHHGLNRVWTTNHTARGNFCRINTHGSNQVGSNWFKPRASLDTMWKGRSAPSSPLPITRFMPVMQKYPTSR